MTVGTVHPIFRSWVAENLAKSQPLHEAEMETRRAEAARATQSAAPEAPATGPGNNSLAVRLQVMEAKASSSTNNQPVQQGGAVNEAIRLLAAVVAKNTVGSSWRKTVATREYSRLPDEERAAVRALSLELLFADPSPRIATQLSLLVTNMARFDFPGKWGGLLSELASVAAWGAPSPVPAKHRALVALKTIVRALSGRPGGVIVPAGPLLHQDLRALLEAAAQEAQQTVTSAGDLFKALQGEWQAHFGALVQGNPDAAGRLALGNRAAGAVAGTGAAGTQPPGEQAERAFERLTQCALAALQHNREGFEPWLPPWLHLAFDAALLAVDAPTVRAGRAKRRVALVRFLACALACPKYRAEGSPAGAAVGVLLAGSPCAAVLEALVGKYLAVTPEELAEWQADPEDYVRSADAEAAPDADAPRPCGLALLRALLNRGGEPVAQELVQLAARLQAQAPTPEALLLREACYRALGEGFSHPALASRVDFKAWYSSELRGLLAEPAGEAGGQAGALLRARSLWLVGTCGGGLPPELYGDALAALAAHLAAPDLVAALAAAHAVAALATRLMIEDSAIQAYRKGAARRRAASLAARLRAGPEQPGDRDAEDTAHQGRMAALAGQAEALLGRLFWLLGRLREPESCVRLLQAVSVVVEVLGDGVAPHLGTVAAALPAVWSRAAPGGGGPTAPGTQTRLHSALIAVLTHLLRRLPAAAMADERIHGLLWPLLAHVTGPACLEGGALLEEALRLLGAALAACPALPTELGGLMPALGRLLAAGHEAGALLEVLEDVALLGGAELLRGQAAALASALAAGLRGVHDAIIAPQQQLASMGGPSGAPTSSLGAEATAEALAGASLAGVLMQAAPKWATGLLEAYLRGVCSLLAAPQAGAHRRNGRFVALVQAWGDLLARALAAQPDVLGALLGGDAAAEGRVLDLWLSAVFPRSFEEEVGIAVVAVLARQRRRLAALALAGAVAAGASPALAQPRGAGRALALVMRALEDEPAFREDEAATQAEAAALSAPGGGGGGEQVILRHVALVAADPLRTVALPAAATAAARAAAARASDTALLQEVGWLDPSLEAALHQLLAQPG
ncbi:hypothetical protein WJX81_001795 [Elliptochloris bilobata]|uniref:Importin N-terminal domain-containing protein n=1 Tax=Elliptochloris bilobata TaxID=381761 RepID=A0AAW1QJE8_9CHLO